MKYDWGLFLEVYAVPPIFGNIKIFFQGGTHDFHANPFCIFFFTAITKNYKIKTNIILLIFRCSIIEQLLNFGQNLFKRKKQKRISIFKLGVVDLFDGIWWPHVIHLSYSLGPVIFNIVHQADTTRKNELDLSFLDEEIPFELFLN